MSAPGAIWYKCRSCGVLYKSAQSPDVHHSLSLALNGTEGYPKKIVDECGGIGLHEVHTCAPGVFGIADLIGNNPPLI